jgi:hypothetical protein
MVFYLGAGFTSSKAQSQSASQALLHLFLRTGWSKLNGSHHQNYDFFKTAELLRMVASFEWTVSIESPSYSQFTNSPKTPLSISFNVIFYIRPSFIKLLKTALKNSK